MLEKILSAIPSPKADPRAMLRANDRSALSDRADDQRDDAAGGFGFALAEDAAQRRAAQKPADHKPERPRHERRSEAAPEGRTKNADGHDTKDAAEDPACVMQEDAAASTTETPVQEKAEPLNEQTPDCRMPAEAKALVDGVISLDLPEVKPVETGEDETPACIMPETTELTAGMDEAVKTDLPVISLPVDIAVIKADIEATERPVDESGNRPVLEAGMISLAVETPVVPAAPPPVIAVVDGAEIGLEDPSIAISLEAGRKVSLPPMANLASANLASTDTAKVDAALAGGLPQTNGARTSVPTVPLAGLDATAPAKTGEGKGFSANNEAISGTVSSFAELIRDFAPQQGMGGLRAADPFSALDRSGMAGLASSGLASADTQRPTPLQMLPIEMGMQAMRGNTRFQIRLDPPELGRVDVKLEISSSGEVKANMVVDRVETLAMLRRDSHSLQYAFEQAGLKQAPDGLSFSLRGEGQNGQQAQDRRENQGRSGSQDSELALLETAAAEKAMRRVSIPLSRIDLVI